MMGCALVKSRFSQLCPQNRRKVHTGTGATGVASHQETPRGVIVSALARRRRLNRQTLKPACSFPEKDRATKVSALTTPDTTTVVTYKHAYTWTNTRRRTRDKLRRCTHHHRQWWTQNLNLGYSLTGVWWAARSTVVSNLMTEVRSRRSPCRRRVDAARCTSCVAKSAEHRQPTIMPPPRHAD